MRSAGASARRPCGIAPPAVTLGTIVLALCVSTSAGAQSATGETAASEAWAKAAIASTPSVPVAIRLSGLSAATGEPANLEANVEDSPVPAGLDTFIADGTARAASKAPPPHNAEFMNVAGATNLAPSPPADSATGTVEIPAASADQTAPEQVSPQTASTASAAPSPQWSADHQTEQDDIARYQSQQDGLPPHFSQSYSPDEAVFATPFGFDLAEARRNLSSGPELDGLLIVNVHKGSPADAAGLHGFTHGISDALTGIAMAGAMAPTPLAPVAIFAVPVIEYLQVGQSYDMIIGVDGSRVTNYLDFTHRVRDVSPGELVYLSVIRDGKRMQVTVTVPPALTARGN